MTNELLLRKKDLLTNLPRELTMDIVRRLPIRCIMRCKFVCKSWRNLIKGGDFTTSYECLAFVHREMGFAICDEAFKPLFQFGFCSNTTCNDRLVVGSANGLLLFLDGCDDVLFVCNPITKEYVEIPRLRASSCIAGFGVSKISGQYKILCRDQVRSYHVYTLERGGGCWRSIAGPKFYPRMPRENAVFFNGNLHWLASDLKESLFVCCFDLETEVFTKFSLPPCDNSNDPYRNWCRVRGDYELCVLEGQLCVCDSLKYPGIVIWWMKNYGDVNSWVKACRIDRPQIGEIVFPLKVFANGDLLFVVNTDNQLVIHNNTTDECLMKNSFLERSKDHVYNIITYIPSFLSLTAMGICNVKSLSFYKDHVLTAMGICNVKSLSFYKDHVLS